MHSIFVGLIQDRICPADCDSHDMEWAAILFTNGIHITLNHTLLSLRTKDMQSPYFDAGRPHTTKPSFNISIQYQYTFLQCFVCDILRKRSEYHLSSRIHNTKLLRIFGKICIP
ncbi:Hypothetical predicted protein [Octopus vulgaris]|uniref:Uncharacterized protein n=1 Tax=Octopus vulgaris TaxID=6645 RepID=A0AA36BLQ8_OCTVU|nr:Hypothetical predicted protein [Octopus vulgaris]